VAGIHSLRGFLNGFPNVSLRELEAKPAALAISLNKVAVSNSCYMLAEMIYEQSLTPDKIFNLEEMKVIVNSKGQPKILA
jgi:hypothetical protein